MVDSMHIRRSRSMLRQVAVLARSRERETARRRSWCAHRTRSRKPAAAVRRHRRRAPSSRSARAARGSESRPCSAESQSAGRRRTVPSPLPPGEKAHADTGREAQSKLPRVETVHELDPPPRRRARSAVATLRTMAGQTRGLRGDPPSSSGASCWSRTDARSTGARATGAWRRRRVRYASRSPERRAAAATRSTSPSRWRSAKYLDHLPLERQARMMAREGLEIESQTLWDQIEALARGLGPTYEALRRHVLAAPLVGADETWWRLTEGKGSKRWWAWTTASADAVSYRILGSRSQEAAREVLAGYGGIVMADGYGVYERPAPRAGAALHPRALLGACAPKVRGGGAPAPGAVRRCLDLIGGAPDAVDGRVPDWMAARRREPRRGAAAARRPRSTSALIAEKIRRWAHDQRALPRAASARRSPTCWGCGRG